MAKALVFMMCPLGIAVALLRRYARVVPAGPAARGDGPERLLRWAAGLLSARREEWGQAMLGELDHIDGGGPRWRFSVGCAGAALLLPPWGRAAAAVWAMTAVAAGAGGPPGTPGWTASENVSDRLGHNVIADLVVVPLVTATIGWAAAAATARIRPRLATSVAPVPFTAAGPTGEAGRHPVTTPQEAGPAVPVRSWRRAAWLLLLWAGVAAAAFLAVASGTRG